MNDFAGSLAGELLDRVIQLADNTGVLDEHRAQNYALVRYNRIYDLVAEKHAQGFSLTGVEAHRSRLSGPRTVITVVLTFTNRQTGVDEKYALRIDATEEYPFLTTPLKPYFER